MADPIVQIVHLEPMRVARIWAFGSSPEHLAWQKLAAWAGPQGLLAEGAGTRIFGFNNPNPSAGSPNYGYEYWITVTAEVATNSETEIREFDGGLYAVMPFDLAAGDPGEIIPAAWRQLDTWLAESPYQPAHHQWLEAHTLQGIPYEVYYPVRPR